MYARLESLLRSQYGMVDQGVGRQRGELAMAGSTAKRTLLDRERQAKSDIQQQSMRRGLSSVTQPLQLRGLGYQTGLGLSGIQEQLGRTFSQLEGQRLQQQLGITGQLGQVEQGRIRQEQRFGDIFAQTLPSNLNPFPAAGGGNQSQQGAMGRIFQRLFGGIGARSGGGSPGGSIDPMQAAGLLGGGMLGRGGGGLFGGGRLMDMMRRGAVA
jgi:hypothetical protein